MRRLRIYVAAENRFLRESLSRMLATRAGIEIVGVKAAKPLDREALVSSGAELVLLLSDGCVGEELEWIQLVRRLAPRVRILMIGMANEPGEFLQCVRAGISGYLLQDSSAEEVLEAIQAVRAGEAVCPGSLCTVLFRYFERETSDPQFASVRQRLGLTRREQQLVPLIAKGFTNKEIAGQLCLSEQTVKNHLYRMKHKIGAEDRFSIVQRYRTQGFLL